MKGVFWRKLSVVPALLTILWAGSGNAGESLMVGVLADNPPMVFRDADTKIVGYDVDVLQEVGRRIGKTMQFKVINWDQKTEELNGKQIDVIASGLSITEERKKIYAFTDPVVQKYTQMLIVNTASPIKERDDLGGKTVCVMEGASAGELVQDFRSASGQTAKVQTAPTMEGCLIQLTAGETDSAVMDGVTCEYYIKHNPGQFRIVPGALSKRQTAFALRLEDRALLGTFNDALKAMEADGTMKRLRERWLGDIN